MRKELRLALSLSSPGRGGESRASKKERPGVLTALRGSRLGVAELLSSPGHVMAGQALRVDRVSSMGGRGAMMAIRVGVREGLGVGGDNGRQLWAPQPHRSGRCRLALATWSNLSRKAEIVEGEGEKEEGL